MKNIVFVSGGRGSFALLQRVILKYGREAVVPVFADTKTEDPDLYRFLDDIERVLGVSIVRIADGRTVWELFFDQGMIANSRADLCSRVLKRDLLRRWMRDNYPPPCRVHLGIDWSEFHRTKSVRRNWHNEGYEVEFLLTEPPHIWPDEYNHLITSAGIAIPRLYELGFAHNNCGGTCVKAGQAQWAQVLEALPTRYAEWEAQEERFRQHTGKDVAILRDRRGGQTRPLTLRRFRERVQAGQQPRLFDDDTSCSCFTGPTV